MPPVCFHLPGHCYNFSESLYFTCVSYRLYVVGYFDPIQEPLSLNRELNHFSYLFVGYAVYLTNKFINNNLLF